MIILLLSAGFTVNAQQYSNSGYHHDHGQEKATDSDMPSVCEHLQALVKHQEHEQAHELIIETLKENPIQPDCFFFNAKLYFNHKLAGRDKHSKYLFDSLLVLYDKWFSSSRNPIEVLNNKGRDVKDYYYKQPDSLRKYCALYKRIYDADRENLHPYNLKMMAFCACDLHDKINIDTLWEFTKNKAITHNDHLWRAPYKSLKRELIKCPKMSCGQLHGYLHPDLLSGREGTAETQNVATLLVQRGCATPKGMEIKTAMVSSDPKVVSSLAVNSPAEKKETVNNFTDLFIKANNSMAEKKYAQAVENYSLAVKSATSPIEKADGYLGMATASEYLKDFKKAKEYATTVHELLPDETEGLRFLSKLYQKGERTCNFQTAKEIAAYNILLSNIAWSLSSSEESDAYKEKAELDELYKSGEAKSGDKVKLGCFIQEEVELP
ncbi:MAG: hypothetical protein H7329_09015 [Opitutaceae bacterium]|nr:hypothetical protein [Cytophagales bacterium]